MLEGVSDKFITIEGKMSSVFLNGFHVNIVGRSFLRMQLRKDMQHVFHKHQHTSYRKLRLILNK